MNCIIFSYETLNYQHATYVNLQATMPPPAHTNLAHSHSPQPPTTVARGFAPTKTPNNKAMNHTRLHLHSIPFAPHMLPPTIMYKSTPLPGTTPIQIFVTDTTTQANASIRNATFNIHASNVIVQDTPASSVSLPPVQIFAPNHNKTNIACVNNVNRTDHDIVKGCSDTHLAYPSVNNININDNSCNRQFYPLPSSAITPINISNFKSCLVKHPDKNLVNYLVNGLSNGFDIGFDAPHTATRPNNLLSATEHREAVTTALKTEVSRGHTAGPFDIPPWPDLHCSPLGSREKKDNTRRLIMDLSQPKGHSINEGIDKEQYSVQYTHFDEATKLVQATGKNCLMSKVDIQHAFRLLPVLPAQLILLGIFWLGKFFVDTRLPFGLRSSPGIFNRFADAVCWIIQSIFKIKNIVQYSDDFFLVKTNNLSKAVLDLNTVKSAFKHLNIPIAENKLEGPQTSITYLGILIDSSELTIRIPHEKYLELSALLPTWLNRKKCTKKELLSLIGKLSFVCKVVRPGRMFLRRLISLSTTAKLLHHHISLNMNARADIQWWVDNISHFNRKSIIPESLILTSLDIKLFTDASNIGFGAIYDNKWIQSRWPHEFEKFSIDFKELFAIFAACVTWGPQWSGKRICFFTDNKPITEIWDSGTTPSDNLMHLIRALYFIAVQEQFSISFKHIPGIINTVADALSRFQVHQFRHHAPSANITPTPLPTSIWDTHQP